MKLVIPSNRYKNSFIEAVKEYQSYPSEDRQDIYALSIDAL